MLLSKCFPLVAVLALAAGCKPPPSKLPTDLPPPEYEPGRQLDLNAPAAGNPHPPGTPAPSAPSTTVAPAPPNAVPAPAPVPSAGPPKG